MLDDSVFDELDAQLDEPEPDAWKPESFGDQIIGAKIGQDTITTEQRNGDKVTTPRFILEGRATMVGETTEGRFTVLLGHTVLSRELLAQRNVLDGDIVAIRYLGSQQGKNGAYTGYKVKCKPERPRKPGDGKSADEQWFDDNWTPPQDAEPPF